jgi:hypothetical protein
MIEKLLAVDDADAASTQIDQMLYGIRSERPLIEASTERLMAVTTANSVLDLGGCIEYDLRGGRCFTRSSLTEQPATS